MHFVSAHYFNYRFPWRDNDATLCLFQLSGYKKPATLEVYIGTDQGRVAPHMFYQACRVSGKNSTPCIEKKVDGTVLIEIEMDPSKDMTVT